MSYAKIITILKGSDMSGNFGHAGRHTGEVGGSAPGGGHAAIGVGGDQDSDTKRQFVQAYRSGKDYQSYSFENRRNLEKLYNMEHNCGVKYDCDPVIQYTGSAYRRMNQYLRGTLSSTVDTRPVIKNIDGMDQVMEAAPRTPAAMKVYRGVSPSVVHNLQAGDIFRDDGFTSTSINPNNAFSGAQLEIRVPKGSKALYVDKISNSQGEDELILDRSSKFKVVAVARREQSDGLVTVEKMVLELIND